MTPVLRIALMGFIVWYALLLTACPEELVPPPEEAVPPRSPTTELLERAASASPSEVRRLIAAGADVSARDEHGVTALHYVAGHGVPAAARELIGAGADPNSNAILPSNAPSAGPGTSSSGAAEPAVLRLASATEVEYGDEDGSPIHWAAHHGNDPEMIKTLIERGADPNGAGYYHTPLHVTVWRQDPKPEFVTALIENGASPNRGRGVRPSEPNGGLTPLCYAAGHWQPITIIAPVITALTKGGSDIQKGRADGYESALHCAASWTENISMIDFLIDLGADPNRGRGVDDHDGSTPLCFAVGRSDFSIAKRIIERLIERGADVHRGTADGYSSTLHCAASYTDSVAMIDFLIDLGADPNRGRGVDDHDGSTPLCFAVGRSDFSIAKRIIERLIERGADVHRGTADGYSSTLHCAASYTDSVAMIDFLIDLGADPNRGRGIDVHDGATPLCFAVERAGLHIVNRLVEHGADPNVGSQGAESTPLHCMGFASDRDDPETALPSIAEYLVEQGVDPAATDSRGDTALHYAAHTGYGAPLAIISALLGIGTPVNARNNDGRTALWVARNDRRDSAPDHQGVIAALVAAGGVE